MRGAVEKSNGDQGGEDRLSSLPECILVDILRLVPFQLAISTSILSRRWRNLWTEHTSIFLNCHNIAKGINRLNPNNIFDCLNLTKDVLNSTATTINRVLERLTSPKLTTFELYFSLPLRSEDQYDALSSNLKPLFGLICGRNIEAIKLLISGTCSSQRCIWLPSCIFQTRSLVKLQLHGVNYNCQLPSVVTLPNLKDLQMDLGNFEGFHRRLLATLSESCPLLQNLRLVCHWIDDAPLIHISSTSLNCLTIQCRKAEKFVIDAPNLDCIDASVIRCPFEFVNKPTKLTKAVITISWSRYHDEMLGLLQGISCSKSLAFVDGLGHSLNLLNFWEDRGGLPLFKELNELSIVLNYRETSKWRNRFPAVMLTKVKKITIEYRNKSKEDMELLKCILSNSFVLELLSVSVSVTCSVIKGHYEEERKFCEELFMLERSSKNCQIQFNGDSFSASSSTFKSRDLACETAI